MTRENLIFLGACTIMSSNPVNFYNRDLRDVEGGMYSQSDRVKQAIGWATHFYDRVHTTDYNQTAAEPTTMEEVLGSEPSNEPDVWIIQRHRFDDTAGKWVRSCTFRGEFATELEAERALDKQLIEKGEDQSVTFRYRVGKL